LFAGRRIQALSLKYDERSGVQNIKLLIGTEISEAISNLFGAMTPALLDVEGGENPAFV
jgi:hypothetical protein